MAHGERLVEWGKSMNSTPAKSPTDGVECHIGRILESNGTVTALRFSDSDGPSVVPSSLSSLTTHAGSFGTNLGDEVNFNLDSLAPAAPVPLPRPRG